MSKEEKLEDIQEQVSYLIEKWGLANFIRKYLGVLEDEKARAFNVEEVMGLRGVNPDVEKIRDAYLKALDEFNQDFIRMHGDDLPVENWVKTFSRLTLSGDIDPKVAKAMTIKL